MKVYSRFLLALTAISLLVVSESRGQADDFNDLFSLDYDYSWDFYGGGARALGMGNAYTALSNEPYGLSWNPAGLVDIPDEEIFLAFDWSAYSPQGDYDFNPGGPANRSGLFNHDGGDGNFFRNAVVTIPTQLKGRPLIVGASVTRHFDTYNFLADKVFPHTSSPGSPDITQQREGYVNSASLGGGLSVSDKLSVGFTANVYFGKIQTQLSRTERHNNLFVTFGPRAGQSFDRVASFTQIDSFAVSGFNFNFGLMYRASEDTRLGLTVRTPFKMKLEDDVYITGDILENGVAQPGGGGSGTVIFPNRQTRVDIPLIVNTGVAHQWSEKFLSSLDIEYRNFADATLQILEDRNLSPQGNEELVFTDRNSQFSNVLQVRVGNEYTIETDYGTIPLRFGFGYLPQPFNDVSEYSYKFGDRDSPLMPIGGVGPIGATEPFFIDVTSDIALNGNRDVDLIMDQSGDQVTAFSFSLGTGLHSSQRSVDIAYTFTTMSRTYHTSQAKELSSAYDPFTSDDPTLFLVDTDRTSEANITDHRISITFTGFF